MNITLVIGGARSGKSSFAENYVDGISKMLAILQRLNLLMKA